MVDPSEFAQKQSELATEFAKYILEHPDVDEILPEDVYVYFEVADDPQFNEYSHDLARRRQREDGVAIACVRVRGLVPPQGSRLMDPKITLTPILA